MPTSLRLMTYNIKFACPRFRPPWEVRRDWQVDLISRLDPDVFGIQEGLKEQVDFLMDHLPDYVFVGEGRKGGDDDEHGAIAFRRDRFRLREAHSFQLSRTPEVIGSGPEVNPRMVTCVRLAVVNRVRPPEQAEIPLDFRGHWPNTREFYVFNTHLFDGGDRHRLARLNGARLIRQRANALRRFGEWTPERPLFLMGDFNARPGGEVYHELVASGGHDDPERLRDTLPDGNGIDWILYRGNVTVTHHEAVAYAVDGMAPSDHKPVVADVTWP